MIYSAMLFLYSRLSYESPFLLFFIMHQNIYNSFMIIFCNNVLLEFVIDAVFLVKALKALPISRFITFINIITFCKLVVDFIVWHACVYCIIKNL